MPNKIQVRRGIKANLPVLSSGELGLATDTKELFIGAPTGNIGIATITQVTDIGYNVKNYGAKGDGVTDDSASIQMAINAAKAAGGGVVYFPTAKYVASELLVNNDDIKLVGNNSTIINTTTNKDTIQIASAISRWTISDFILDRSVTATIGAGIKQLLTQSSGRIDNVLSKRNFIGFYLRSTDSSIISRCTALNNVSHGFYMFPDGSNGALQWNFHGTCLASDNGGDGFRMESGTAPIQVACGTMNRFDTFNNGGYGISVLGTPACPIHGFRLYEAFIGEDGNHCLYMDTYGTFHMLGSIFAELSGKEGIHITVNNSYMNANNINVSANNHSGMYFGASNSVINTISAINNGVTGSGVLEKMGVFLVGDKITCNSVYAANRTGITFQSIGVYLAGNYNIVTNGITENNTVSQFSIDIPATSKVIHVIIPGFVQDNKGSTTGTPNGSGIIVVPHGLGSTPTNILISVRGTVFANAMINSVNGTDINVKLWDAAGAAITTGTFTVFFQASV